MVGDQINPVDIRLNSCILLVFPNKAGEGLGFYDGCLVLTVVSQLSPAYLNHHSEGSEPSPSHLGFQG